jgi:hypothetical protein
MFETKTPFHFSFMQLQMYEALLISISLSPNLMVAWSNILCNCDEKWVKRPVQNLTKSPAEKRSPK